MTALGIPVPDDLAQALDAARAVAELHVEVPALEQQISTATPDQVAELVRTHAQAVATRDTLDASKRIAEQAAARRVIRAQQAAAPGFVEALRPAFLDAANRYFEGLLSLPPKIKEGPVDGLRGLSPEHLEAWQQFDQARAELDAFKTLRNVLTGSPRSRYGFVAAATRFAKPVDFGQAHRATKNPDAEQQRRLGFLHRYVEEGVELWWPSKAEQQEHIRFLERDAEDWRPTPRGYERRPAPQPSRNVAWT